jgi:lysophospholipase L1-like esterase
VHHNSLRRPAILLAVLSLALTLANDASAQRGEGPGRGFTFPALGPATEPAAPRTMDRHDAFLEIARAGDIDLLFVGDSITDGWDNGGEAVYNEYFVPMKVANFGIGGDTTQGVLWRMQNGELEGFEARLIVHMLGTNNINRNENSDIVAGNQAILQEYRSRQPQAKVLLLGVFPRGEAADNPNREAIAAINEGLAALDDGENVFYLDIGEAFLTEDGVLTQEVMPDGLHPNAHGYQLWADAMIDRVRELME